MMHRESRREFYKWCFHQNFFFFLKSEGIQQFDVRILYQATSIGIPKFHLIVTWDHMIKKVVKKILNRSSNQTSDLYTVNL